jgi:hypothetical protein
MNRTSVWLTLLGLATAIPSVTLAVDGVVLINQANALAGNVTPGDSPGFPVTISVSGRYQLSSNLTVADADTDAIDITASNVTIDLNGFSIIGPVVCSGGVQKNGPTGAPPSCIPTGGGTGVFSPNPGNAVLNGEIHGMGAFGIELGVLSRVEKVHVSGNRLDGINVREGSEVSSCVASSNGGNGIVTGTEGSIRNNSANYNASAGILAFCVSLIEGNMAGVNFGAGNIVTAGSGCVLVNNATQ